MAELHDLAGFLPAGMQKLLDLSERVFIFRLSREGIILACSDSLRRILSEPHVPVGRQLEELFLPVAESGKNLCLTDLTAHNGASSLLARMAMINRPCRLLSLADGESFICWGEVIGDRNTTGLNEFSGFVGQIQSLLAQIRKQNNELQQGLKAAAWMQQRFLPEVNHFARIQTAWQFRPCESIGGDYFNIFMRKDGRVAAYILDVSGHGLASAMMGAAATQSLQQMISNFDTNNAMGSDMPLLLAKLEQEFPLERFNLYFSMVYLEIDHECQRITWINAGHPEPILARHGQSPVFMKGGGPFIGLDHADLIEEQTLELQPGDRIFLYSDGITERRNSSGDFFGTKQLLRCVEHDNPDDLQQSVDHIVSQNDAFGENLAAQDDLALLALEIPD